MVVSISWRGLSVVLVYKMGFISLIYNWLFCFLFELVGFTSGSKRVCRITVKFERKKSGPASVFRKPTRHVWALSAVNRSR